MSELNPQQVVIDTNILLDNPEVLVDKKLNPIIPYTVLAELDNLKRNPDLKRAAQSAIKLIYAGLKDGHITVPGVPQSKSTNDEKIIQSAKKSKCPILTDDIGARAVAMANNVPILEDFDTETIDFSYTGYQVVQGDVDYENNFVPLKEMQVEEFECKMSVKLKHNEYCIVERIGNKNDIWKRKRDKANNCDKVVRISQKMSPYYSAGIKGSIHPLDDVQMCVLDAVFDPDIPLTVIDGKLGTGKTMLTLMAALASINGEKRYMNYDQIMVTASPESVNKALYTGYKPGETENKLGGHLRGFKTNLKFLLDPEREKLTLKQRKEGKPTDSVVLPSDEAWTTFFEIIEIDEVQGASLHGTILLVDEYQKLSEESLKLVLSRISEGSKVILIGDTEGQVYGLNRAHEGFRVLYKHFGKHQEFSYIKMENIYRSALAEMVEEIFD